MQISKPRRFLYFLRSLLILEPALLLVVALLWYLTAWHDTSSYISALLSTGELFLFLGTLIAVGPGGDAAGKLAECETEMRSWDRRNDQRFAANFGGPDLVARWMICLGLANILVVLALNKFVH